MVDNGGKFPGHPPSEIRRQLRLWLLESFLSEVSTTVLQAELFKRNDTSAPKPSCGSGRSKGTYDTSLHVFALILILVLSTAGRPHPTSLSLPKSQSHGPNLACSFPILVKRVPNLPIPVPHRFLFLSRHFGTGVLIATAFVHLLPTAFISLTDPCLPRFWNKGYPAMAGLIAMISVFVVVGVEMFFAMRGAGHVHASDYGATPVDNGDEHSKIGGLAERRMNGHRRRGSEALKYFQLQEVAGSGYFAGEEAEQAPSTPQIAVHPPSSPNSPVSRFHDIDTPNISHLSTQEPDNTTDTTNLLNHQSPASDIPNGHVHPSTHSHPHQSHPESHSRSQSQHDQQKRLLLQCLLLEAGILFHSIFIGLALSVTTGPPFLILLIAISFHQTFEGFALGSRIAAATTSPIPGNATDSVRPYLMALAYGLTTPIGQAIGLSIHNLYDPASETGLLMVGIMNAVSSGLLVFAGLVELLAEDFLSEGSLRELKGRSRGEACGSVVAGGALMAFVGGWA